MVKKTVRLVIELPEEEYEFLKGIEGFELGGRTNGKTLLYHLINAIKNSNRVIKGDCWNCKHAQDFSKEALAKCGKCIKVMSCNYFEPEGK